MNNNGKISEVYLMDCMEYMAALPDNYFDLAVVDPPYGIDIETSGTYFKQFQTKGWDNEIPNREYFQHLKRISINQIIWGGNYFLEYLGNAKCFLIWDKMIGDGMSFADGEMAWTSFKKPTRIKRLLSRSENGKQHPTQKPVALYKWILKNYAKPGDKIFDSHMGSQSSRIAAYDMGFDYWGCEIDKDYFEAGNKRFENFRKQLTMFSAIQPMPTNANQCLFNANQW
jgi:site-specific DNA-methyltransferase (adenine-specific)